MMGNISSLLNIRWYLGEHRNSVEYVIEILTTEQVYRSTNLVTIAWRSRVKDKRSWAII